MAQTAVRLKIVGLVHGVFFRAGMAQKAAEAGVRGWVRNMPDGSVEAYLVGEDSSVTSVVTWARRGPPRARVDSMKVDKAEVRNLRGFRIEG